MIDFITDINKLNPQSNFLKDGLWYDDYNSAFLLNKKEEIALYHKSKLVVELKTSHTKVFFVLYLVIS